MLACNNNCNKVLEQYTTLESSYSREGKIKRKKLQKEKEI